MSHVVSRVAPLFAQRIQAINKQALGRSLEKISTAQRINRGRDDPSGLIRSGNLNAALAMLEAESRVLQRVDSVATVAEGALVEVSDLLVEAKGLAVTNANTGALGQAQIAANQLQIDSILTRVDRISRTAGFNGSRLLDGTAALTADGETLAMESTATTQLGEVEINGQALTLSDIGSGGALNTVDGNIAGAGAVIDAAVSQVATMRGRIGAFQKNAVAAGLAHRAVAIENTAAANSVIRDTDFGSETSVLARALVLDRSSLLALEVARHSAANVAALLG